MARLIVGDAGVAMTVEGLPGLAAGTLLSRTDSVIIGQTSSLYYKMDIVNLADPLVTSLTVAGDSSFTAPQLIVLNVAQSYSALLAAPNMMPLMLSGADSVLAGVADDTLYAFDGADSVDGGTGADQIYGNAGADVLKGGAGADKVFGGRDNDVVTGGEGQDQVYGNLGDDVVYGNADADQVYGGQGGDTLYGGAGDDRLFGNKGDDWIWVGPGYDQAYGGEGADTFAFAGDTGEDLLFDVDPETGDRIVFQGGLTVQSLEAEGENTLIHTSLGGLIRVVGVPVDEMAGAITTLP